MEAHAFVHELSGNTRMWIPIPTTDAFQTIKMKALGTPGEWDMLQERKHGNKVLFLTLGPDGSAKSIVIRYQVERLEKRVYPAKTTKLNKYLEPENLVPANMAKVEFAFRRSSAR